MANISSRYPKLSQTFRTTFAQEVADTYILTYVIHFRTLGKPLPSFHMLRSTRAHVRLNAFNWIGGREKAVLDSEREVVTDFLRTYDSTLSHLFGMFYSTHDMREWDEWGVFSVPGLWTDHLPEAFEIIKSVGGSKKWLM